MTSQETIYNRFAQKITDYGILDLPKRDLESMLSSWLTSAIAKFRRCEHDLSQRDDDMQEFSVDLNDTEIEILALLMVNEWLEPQVNSELYTSQFFGGKEEKLEHTLLARCDRKLRSVFLRICWNSLRAAILKQKDETSLNVTV